MINENLDITLIDFGCALNLKHGHYLDQVCGSIFYMAPELFKDKYNTQVDVWAVGVIMYALMTKRFPFDDVQK